jgi:hypothetical protein
LPGARLKATLTVRMDVPEPPVTGPALPVIAASEPSAVRVTVPVKPVIGVTVRVDVPDEPWGMVRDAGLADRAKFVDATLTATTTEWTGLLVGLNVPLPVAVTVTEYDPAAAGPTDSVAVLVVTEARSTWAGVTLEAMLELVIARLTRSA